MMDEPKRTKVQASGKYSRCVILTEQLKELGINLGDNVYCNVKENKIVIERAKEVR